MGSSKPRLTIWVSDGSLRQTGPDHSMTGRDCQGGKLPKFTPGGSASSATQAPTLPPFCMTPACVCGSLLFGPARRSRFLSLLCDRPSFQREWSKGGSGLS